MLISTIAGAQEAAKPYALFMGANISVGQGPELHPVRDISGGSWVIVVDGKPVQVSAANGPISMKVIPLLKLTKSSAVVANLKGERAYTFANDPAVKMTRSMNQSASLDVGSHTAMNQATSDANGSLAAVSQMGSGASSTGHVSSGASTAMHNAGYSQAAMDAASTSAGPELFSKGANGDPEGAFDALDIAFDVSAGKELGDPFIVVITRFHERGADAGTSRELVYAKALAPIDAKGMNVKFEQAGFPPGFELQTFEIHLYNQGEEVATNIALKRSDLTGDEAFAYVKAKYLGAHNGATLAAAPVMGELPEDLASRLMDGKYAVTFYVKVSKDGLADEPFADPACTKRIEDPYLASVVRSIRFKPALEHGEPVEGVAPLNLSHLRM
jgi:hypothetical protein